MSRKLNQRLATIPAAAVVTSAWLKARGISSRLADYYCRSGWLHRVGDGAFTTRTGTPSWMGAVHGLQQKPSSVHPGGRTALEIFGHAHFIPLGSNYPIYLFGRTNDRLPSWFRGLSWFGRVQHVRTNFLPDGLGLCEHCDGELRVTTSTVERAILEFLQHLPLDASSYEHANLIFESLGGLRPELVQSLLSACTSIRVKRLFLHLAERHSHTWMKHLDLTQISLGRGKRSLVSGGRLDSKYLITVPGSADDTRTDFL